MLMRIEPCDFFGMDNATAFATCAAVTLLPRPTFIGLIRPLFTATELPTTLANGFTDVVGVDVVPVSGDSGARS